MEEREPRDVGDERAEFLERRATGIGATDSPKILGLSRWGTALTVYEDKVAPRPQEMSLPAWLGLKLQSTVAELYTAQTGTILRADNRHHRHPEHDWMVCHLDFRAKGQPSLLVECKTKAWMTGWGEEGSVEIPVDIWVQVQHEMAVTGATECDVAVLFGHHTFRVYRVVRDDPFIATMIPRLATVWFENIIPRIPPEPTGHELDTAAVKRAHPEHDDTWVAATAEDEAFIKQVVLARQNANVAEANKDEQENKLRVLIGRAQGITGSFGQITYRQTRDREEIDWAAVAVTQGAVIEDLLTLVNPGDDEEMVRRLAIAQSTYESAVSLATTPKAGYRRFAYPKGM